MFKDILYVFEICDCKTVNMLKKKKSVSSKKNVHHKLFFFSISMYLRVMQQLVDQMSMQDLINNKNIYFFAFDIVHDVVLFTRKQSDSFEPTGA